MREIRENGTLTLIAFGYDDQGRRQSLTYENGVTTAYGYDGLGRLASHVTDMHGVSGDQSLTFAYNPAGQIVANSRSNDLYSYAGLANAATADAHNGLNQITTTGGTSMVHDARGNTIQIGTDLFTYSSENLMTSQTGAGGALTYDPLTRLARTAYNTRFAYDGTALVEEHKNANLIARYVHGPGTDEPLVWYDTGGTRRYLHADERGSIVAISADGGTTFPGGLIWQMNEYDEYGRPTSNNFGRFGYTGQVWLPEHNLWYYKARMYDPLRGRFMQTDPIGYEGGINLYVSFNSDPLNLVDPTGQAPAPSCGSLIPGVNNCGGMSGVEFRESLISGSASEPVRSYRTRFSISVSEEDRRGGHTRRYHVGKDDSFLRRRLSTALPGSTAGATFYLRETGTFTSLNSADRLVSAALSQKAYEVDSFLRGTAGSIFITAHFSAPTGRTMYSSAPVVSNSRNSGSFVTETTYGVGVFLMRAPHLPNGFYVRTAYPISLHPTNPMYQ